MPVSLESAFDELYAVEPASFVETRARLVSELRAAKEADAAKTLASARRPTRSAWAINQVTRQHPAAIESLLRTSAALGDLQSNADPDSRDELRAAFAAHRAALNDAIDAAVAVLGATPSDAIRTEIATTFQAASVDPGVAADVRLGRLTVARTASTVFPEVEWSSTPRLRVVRQVEEKPAPALERAWQVAIAAVAAADAAAAEADALVVELRDALTAAKADAAEKAGELRAARDREATAKRDLRRAP